MYIVNALSMWEQDHPGRPVPGSSFDDAGYMSEDENSWENISVVDTDSEEATANNGHQDTKKIDFKERFNIPDDILLLDRRDLPRMVSVVYGCDIDKVPAPMKEDVSKQNRQQEGRGRKGSGSNSSSRTGNLRRAAGQQRQGLPGVEPYGAGPSVENGGHLNAAVAVGTNDIEDDEMRGRKGTRSSSAPESQRRLLLRCEACGHQLPPFIQALAQRRATTSLAAGEEGAGTDGVLPEHPQIQKASEVVRLMF